MFPALSADGTLTATFEANVVAPLTITLLPTGFGNDELTRNTGSSNYQAVDDTGSGDGDSTYVYDNNDANGYNTDTTQLRIMGLNLEQ